jgi:hypothetical protein
MRNSDTVDPRDLPSQGHVTFVDDQTGVETDSRDLMLILTDVDIEDPEARRFEVTVPGRDNDLDLTEALGGVYFDRRTVTLSFACVNWSTQRHWLLASHLRNLLDGRRMRVILSDDLGYYWLGRCAVEVDRPGAEVSEVTVTVDADAHKYSVNSSYEPWKWSPFSFVDGVVTRAEDVVLSNETKTVTLPVDPARLKPTLWLNTGGSGSVSAKLSTDTTWHVLRSGKNTVPEIRQSDRSEVVLQLRGTGRVGVDYRVGSL